MYILSMYTVVWHWIEGTIVRWKAGRNALIPLWISGRHNAYKSGRYDIRNIRCGTRGKIYYYTSIRYSYDKRLS